MSHRKVSISEAPKKAPSRYRDLPGRVVTADGEGLWLTWHGPGEACADSCEACQNDAGNLLIYANWGHSYPNGNSWSDKEIVCGSCGKYSYVCEFTEG